MKIVLVTGGTGLVGSAIKEVYHKKYNDYQYFFLSSKDCDLTNLEDTKPLFFYICTNKIFIFFAPIVFVFYLNET